MTLDDLHQLLITNAKNKTEEYTRLFHGRGHFYGAYKFLTVDSADKVLYAAFFAPDEEEETIVSVARLAEKDEADDSAPVEEGTWRRSAGVLFTRGLMARIYRISQD